MVAETDMRSQIFEIEYPLPKADLLAVHEFVSATLPFLCTAAFCAFGSH